MDTDKLIDSIVKRNAPVKRMSHPLKRAFIWLLMAAMLMLFAVMLFGVRDDIMQKIAHPLFVIELLSALATGLLAALAAHWLAVPDACGKTWMRWLPFIPLSILCAVIVYHFVIMPVNIMEFKESFHCISDVLLIISLPTLLLFMFIRRAATTQTKTTSLMAITAVLAFGYFSSRIICPVDSMEHLLVWNYVPTVVIALLGAYIGNRLLKW